MKKNTEIINFKKRINGEGDKYVLPFLYFMHRPGVSARHMANELKKAEDKGWWDEDKFKATLKSEGKNVGFLREALKNDILLIEGIEDLKKSSTASTSSSKYLTFDINPEVIFSEYGVLPDLRWKKTEPDDWYSIESRLLFSVEEGSKPLNDGERVPKWLREEFQNKNIPLPSNAKIRKPESSDGNEFWIKCKDERYYQLYAQTDDENVINVFGKSKFDILMNALMEKKAYDGNKIVVDKNSVWKIYQPFPYNLIGENTIKTGMDNLNVVKKGISLIDDREKFENSFQVSNPLFHTIILNTIPEITLKKDGELDPFIQEILKSGVEFQDIIFYYRDILEYLERIFGILTYRKKSTNSTAHPPVDLPLEYIHDIPSFSENNFVTIDIDESQKMKPTEVVKLSLRKIGEDYPQFTHEDIVKKIKKGTMNLWNGIEDKSFHHPSNRVMERLRFKFLLKFPLDSVSKENINKFDEEDLELILDDYFPSQAFVKDLGYAKNEILQLLL